MLSKTGSNEPDKRQRRYTEERVEQHPWHHPHQQEQFFRQVAEAIPQIVWTADAQGTVEFYNQRWYDYIGRTPEQSVGMDPLEVVHPEDREVCLSHWSEALRTGTQFELEVRLKRARDGVYRWHLARTAPMCSAEGRIVQWFGTSTDIHEHKQYQLTQQFLHELQQATFGLEDTEEVLGQTVRRLGAFLDADRCNYADADYQEDCYVIHRDYCRGVRSLTGKHRFEDYGMSLIESFNRGQTVVNCDITRDPCTAGKAAAYRSIDVGAFISVPILRNGQCVGNLSVMRAAPHQWTSHEVELVEIVASRTWLAVQNVQFRNSLRESEERYRTLFDAIDEGFQLSEVVTDEHGQAIDTRILEVNRAWQRMTGLNPEVVCGRRVWGVLPDLEQHWLDLASRVGLGRETIRSENYAAPLGRWFDCCHVPVGAPRDHRYAVVFRDITERKRTEAALCESEDRLRLAVESAQLGTYDWDLPTDSLEWDDGHKAMFGLPPEAQVNTAVFFAGLHPDDRERLHQLIANSCNPATGGEHDVEYRTIGLQDGIERWVRAKGKVYFDAAGAPLRFVGVVQDITEQKQAEAERRRLLEQEQRARQEAEQANQAKDQFLALLSHELRTPLNPIIGFTQLMRRGPLTPQQKNGLEIVERNARLLTQLIDDLLDVSRIVRGAITLRTQPVALEQIVRSALETVRSSADDKAVRLVEVLDMHAPLQADATRMTQVVWNLLTNAVKFTPSGGEVRVRLERSEDQVRLIITDSGEGIASECMPAIFERFWQANTTASRTHQGLGLGLFIVRHLVELHGGQVWAESPGPGQGTTFVVELPLADHLLQD